MNIKELRAVCQETAPAPANESVVGRFSRVFSVYITILFLKTSITPNQITSLSVLVFFTGLAFFFSSSYLLQIAGALIVFFSVVLDGCDGETARYRKIKKVSGGSYVEPVSHDVQYGLMFLIIGSAVYFHGGSSWYLLAGAWTSIIKLLFRLLEVRWWYNFVQPNISKEEIEVRKYEHHTKAPYIRAIYWINKNIFSSAGLVGPLFFFVLFRRLDLFLWFYAIGFTLSYVMLFLKQVRTIYIKDL